MALAESSSLGQAQDERLAHLQAAERAVLAACVAQLREHYGDDLLHLALFGSKARGDSDAESDLDLFIVVRVADDENQRKISDIVQKIQFEYYMVSTLIIEDEAGYAKMRKEHLLLFRNIRRDGIVLWTTLPKYQGSWDEAVDETTRRTYIQVHLVRAHDALASAHTDLEHGHMAGTANRAYYAVFHSASAALLWQGVERARHAGVYAAFGEFLVKPGYIEPEFSDIFIKLSKTRKTQDYAMDAPRLSTTEAAALVGDAESFVARVEHYLHEVGAIQ